MELLRAEYFQLIVLFVKLISRFLKRRPAGTKEKPTSKKKREMFSSYLFTRFASALKSPYFSTSLSVLLLIVLIFGDWPIETRSCSDQIPLCLLCSLVWPPVCLMCFHIVLRDSLHRRYSMRAETFVRLQIVCHFRIICVKF